MKKMLFVLLSLIIMMFTLCSCGSDDCGMCNGSGYYEQKTCPACSGSGSSDYDPYEEMYGD